MLNGVAFANSLALLTEVFYLLLFEIQRRVPDAVLSFSSMRNSGANVAALLPKASSFDNFVGTWVTVGGNRLAVWVRVSVAGQLTGQAVMWWEASKTAGFGSRREGGSMWRNTMLALTLALAGCGGHHDHTGGSSPSIFNLVISTNSSLVFGTPATYRFQVEFVDPDGDLLGGSCDLDSSIGPASLPLQAVLAGTDPNATNGLVVCEFTTTVLGRVVTGFLTVTDRRGHLSNALSFSVPAEGRRLGAAAAAAGSAS